ncbi:MAG TPA: D-alanyl-D-alanine carboxypeptidase/D-alanyl-D-alanine-endopeptidase, partial [Longimicrobiales bacterium]
SWIAIPDPETFTARALVAALRRKSITVTGAVRVLRDSAALAALPPAQTAFTWQSPPMKDIIAGIMKPSQNWIAEQLLKTLGAVKGTGGNWRDGLNVERRYLIDVVHIDSTAFSLSDGSGLSAQNVVSPHAFVMLLEHARRASWGEQYRAALPVPGMRGGTLSTRLSGLETRLSAKTGSIANVNSLSGYVRTAGGRDLTFSVLTNGSGRSSADVRRGIDAFVQALARDQSRP